MNNNLTPFLLFAVAIGLYYVYINPMYAQVNELRAKEAQYADALAQVQEIESLRDELLSRYNGFSQEDIDRLQGMLPDSVDNVRLVLDLDGIASRHNVVLKSVRITRQANDVQMTTDQGTTKPYNSVRVAFTVVTTYESFTAFVKDVEQSLRIMDVTGISIRPQLAGKTEFGVTVNTYWLK